MSLTKRKGTSLKLENPKFFSNPSQDNIGNEVQTFPIQVKS
jgi:hypothetical protein